MIPNQHKANILSESIASQYDLEPGHIAHFSYRGKRATVKRPLVVVLNPDHEGYLHGLTLSILDEDDVSRVYGKIKESIIDKVRGLVPGLRPRIHDPALFYQNEVLPLLRTLKDNPYRTYIRNGISSLNIIDYRFKDYNSI